MILHGDLLTLRNVAVSAKHVAMMAVARTSSRRRRGKRRSTPRFLSACDDARHSRVRAADRMPWDQAGRRDSHAKQSSSGLFDEEELGNSWLNAKLFLSARSSMLADIERQLSSHDGRYSAEYRHPLGNVLRRSTLL